MADEAKQDIFQRLMRCAKQVHEDRLCAEFGPGGGNSDAKLEDCIEYQTAKEIERLRQWVNDLQSGMYINCVYCGHRYGPKENTAPTMQQALYDHIATCPKHPLSKANAKIKRFRSALKTIRAWADHRDPFPVPVFVVNRIAAICEKALGYSADVETK